ncbi:Pyridoxine 4-dehydrogenase [Didymella keratinophila]|nr:Pyridoxine 4-dehydrogenase [Didymella keratinophila]
MPAPELRGRSRSKAGHVTGNGAYFEPVPNGTSEPALLHQSASQHNFKALRSRRDVKNGIHYGTHNANSLHLLRHYFEKYPEDADKVVVSIKGALWPTREPTGSPEAIRASVEEAYQVLKGIKTIDVFEMARVDPNVPIETAHAVHKIAAVEIELSLFTPDPFYNGIKDTCAGLDIAVAAYSPVGRGLLTGTYHTHSDILANDFRHLLARFNPEAFEQNAKLSETVDKSAQRKGMTSAQVAIAWVVSQGAIPIPGSSKIERVEANSRAMALTEEDLKELEGLRKQFPGLGERKTQQLQKLEQKLESLADALAPKHGQKNEDTLEKPTQLPITGAFSVEEMSLDLDTQDLRATPKIMLGSTLTPSQYTMSNVIVSFTNLSRCEIENLLDRYKTLMAPHMPFVLEQAFPTTASSSTSPVVSKALVAVAHFHDTPTQKILAEELVQHITSKIFTNAEKSLEILQALLILCTWYNPHIFTSSSHTSLLHLCMALTTDLAIDRDPMSCDMVHMAAALESCGIPQPVKNISDEEQRAVMGVFWVASTMFTSFRKSDVPTWTPWLQQCLDTLKRSEQERDIIIVGLVQSQKIMHQAMSPSLLRLPEALQTELDDINPAAIKTTDDLTRTLLSL